MKKTIQLTESELINLIEKMIKEYDKPAMDSFKKQYGKKKGKSVYYATANKQKRNPETFKLKEELSDRRDALDLIQTSIDPNSYELFDDYYNECFELAKTEYNYSNEEEIKKFCKKRWLERE